MVNTLAEKRGWKLPEGKVLEQMIACTRERAITIPNILDSATFWFVDEPAWDAFLSEVRAFLGEEERADAASDDLSDLLQEINADVDPLAIGRAFSLLVPLSHALQATQEAATPTAAQPTSP